MLIHRGGPWGIITIQIDPETWAPQKFTTGNIVRYIFTEKKTSTPPCSKVALGRIIRELSTKSEIMATQNWAI